jgi:hypothetical protein
MRHAALALAALLAPLQDETIDALIRRLTDASIEARQAAADELVRIGPRALPALEKAAGAGDEALRLAAQDAIRRIQARKRAADLGLEKLVPAAVLQAVPGALERATGTAEEKVKLYDDLRAAIDAGNLREADLAWIGALLKGSVSADVRTRVYLDAKRWWTSDDDDTLRESGRKILAEMGEAFLRDWARIVVKIADDPDEVGLFSHENNRGEGPVTIAAIQELAELGLPEVVPLLVDIATDYSADENARIAALKAVSALRKRK